MWNVIDFVTNSLYVATVALRVVSYFQVCIPFALHIAASARTSNTNIRTFHFLIIFNQFAVAAQVQKEMTYDKFATDRPREQWNSWDPMLLSGD